MSAAPPFRDTPLATVRYTAPDRVEVRFKPGVPFTVPGIEEMMRVRQELGAAGPHRAIMLLPDHVEFDIPMITTDHYAQLPQPNTLAVAWVARNERNATFTRMYLAAWPPPFPAEVFLEEEEAHQWLGWG
ncbi:MAG: hypothetical protein KIT10_16150 [Flavobacteriales bacterium]|nr:hypothetical protein [Flavobacteriales bacterium]